MNLHSVKVTALFCALFNSSLSALSQQVEYTNVRLGAESHDQSEPTIAVKPTDENYLVAA